ncbi:CHAD domain-containing protein [Actinoalloteichus hoggarensis]|uniref:CHAD domain protein n=1 Tax=Actinoalloteichus hoggarensis TaxID=1470176 RepID=A0A221VZL8_9PSEU|nr:CHAD domain-containing protein [Actinoalloteichus hoggarensis]ASO18972.1 CHAD domain protein [Actinoalloteichus hoggarensis]MBB5920208.1 CHAD domain-containing protein [Actinoalloteichus hoggarensis]
MSTAARSGPPAPAAPKKKSPGLNTRSPAGDVVLDHLRGQAAALFENEQGFHRGEPGSVHRMRVATRRLRSALQSFGTIVDREQTRELTDELRRLGRVLGRSRDAEVVTRRLRDRIEETPAELVLGEVDRQLTRRTARRQAAADETVIEELASERYRALTESIRQLLDRPPLTSTAADRAGAVLPALVARSWRGLDRTARTALSMQAEASAGTGTAGIDSTGAGETRTTTSGSREQAALTAALHEVRKRARRTRYAAEVARPVARRKARRLSRALRRLQRTLGTHQDTVLSRAALRELGAQARTQGQNGFTFGLWYGRDQEIARRIEEDFAEHWHRAARPRLRRWTR